MVENFAQIGIAIPMSAARALLRTAVVVLLASPGCAPAPLTRGFVDATTVVDGLSADMRYFGDRNFVGAKIDGYEQPRCFLSAPAAQALAAVQRDLAPRGLGLKVFD